MAIYLKLPDNLHLNNIDELLIYGYNNGFVYRFVETYADIECKQRECHSARRSFEDLLEICQTYFPETTERDLAKSLYKLSHTENALSLKPGCHIRIMYCSTIEKMVFTTDDKTWEYYCDERGDSHTLRNRNGKGKYCYNDIMYLLIDFPQ